MNVYIVGCIFPFFLTWIYQAKLIWCRKKKNSDLNIVLFQRYYNILIRVIIVCKTKFLPYAYPDELYDENLGNNLINDNYCKQMFVIGTLMDNTICFSSLMLMHSFEVFLTVVISIYKKWKSKSIYYLIQQDMRINEQMGNTICNRSFFV